ncbi:MAG: PorV/PorQ family protein [Ignavibacteriaceae bacterium]|nr:PorV/PorQ family protein [Ignavibacteriaceae bacterium]
MKKLIIIFALINIVTFSQDFNKKATAGFVFLGVPASARTASLAEASIALSDLNSDAIFVNPAGTGFVSQEHSFSVSYAAYIADITHYSSTYTYNTPYGVFGVGIVAMDFGSMQKTVVTTSQKFFEVVGTFDAKALAAAVSYSKMLTDKFSFGIQAKYVEEGIDVYKASNIVFDGGVLYYTGLGSLRIAAVMQNFGTDAKYVNDPFKMPTVFKLGLASEILPEPFMDMNITGLLEAIHPNDGDERINTGLEINYMNMLYLRGGYKFLYDEETYSIGLGVKADFNFPVAADFALANYGRLGNVLRLTVSTGLF